MTHNATESTPYVAQWGILGCGWISSEFAKDLCRSPAGRGASDISHAIVAVGSRSQAKADAFVAEFVPRGAAAQVDGLCKVEPRGHGSYAGVVNDPNAHIVYIGTTTSAHYDDARLVLEAGKHCLVEKPATLNAAEWADLSTLAKKQGVFLMEGVWTRFNPCFLAIEKAILHDNVIGDIRCIYSDNSLDWHNKKPDSTRMLSAEQAGGSVLDLGPYPLVYTMMLMYRHPKNGLTPPAQVGSTMMLSRTGVDLASSVTLTFPQLEAIAYLTMNSLSSTPKQLHTRIVGTTGEILIKGWTSRPSKFWIRRLVDPAEGGVFLEDEEVDCAFDEFGLCFEADAVARCVRDGLLECPRLPHEDTLMTMGIFDQVRKQGGYEFLPGLEKVK